MKKVYIIEILLIAVMVISLSTVSMAIDTNMSNTTSITYRSDVDQDYGFYRVIDIIAHKPAPYVNNTLTINVGDTVIWINDATPDEPLTIISKEELWGNRSAYLRWNYQKFNYTFNKSGTYDIYIKEYPREQHQIIEVKTVEPIVTVISTPTIVVDTIVADTPDVSPIEITPIDTVAAKKTTDLTTVWLLIIVAGLIIYVIYIYKKR